ncbi:MAG TPA: hypothetical protein VIF62_28950 [Labilithrix sp.]
MKNAPKVWTWDRGARSVDMDGDPEHVAPILETVLQGGLWEELEKFPPETVERLLPRVRAARNIRRLVEIWIEERRREGARPPPVARTRPSRHRRQRAVA